MRLQATNVAVISVLLLSAGLAPASATPVTFSGIDNNGAEVALSSTPNSDAARNAFFSNLVGVGTETFESLSGGVPLPISFGAAGTATLAGSGSVVSVAPGATNGAGRYSVPSATSSRYFEVQAGNNFAITFSSPIAAFGFYGIDIGDFNGTVSLALTDVSNNVLNLLVPAAPVALANASVLYFGFYDLADTYKSIAFNTTTGSGDVFAFDNFSIGSNEQVVVTRVPEPSSIALLSAGLAGFSWMRRKRRQA